jgi:hypothetical protein
VYQIAEHDTGDWPTYAAAWPDHWSHGLGSATARMAQARRTQRRRAAAAALVEQAQSDDIRHSGRFASGGTRLAIGYLGALIGGKIGSVHD